MEIKFSEKDPKLVMDELDTMKIDVGVIRGQHVEASHYKLYPLIDDELVLVTNRAHRFAGRTEIDLAEASTEQFVFLYESTFMFKTCLKVCEEAGFFPNYRKLDVGLRTIQSFVAQGMGVSLLMKGTVADAPDSDLCIVALKQKPILTLSLVVRNSVVSPAVKDFVQFALKYFSSHTPSSLETSSASGEQPVRQLF